MAQSNAGSVTGTVRDGQDEVIPGATVELLNIDTGRPFSCETDGQGRYHLTGVPAGTRYTLQVRLTGYKEHQRTSLVITPPITEINVQLEIGELTETVSVVSELPLVETQTGTLQRTLTAEMLSAVPSGAALKQALILIPQIPNNVQSDGVLASPGPGPATFTTLVDGVTWQDLGLRTNLDRSIVPRDAIDVVSPIDSFRADFSGATGGGANVSTRSGTNTFRGAVFGTAGYDLLNAQNAFGQPRGETADLDAQVQGITLGGPIVRDKTFFFTAFEDRHQRADATFLEVESRCPISPEPSQPSAGPTP